MEIHVVKKGETPYSIAKQYGISVQRLIYDNQIENPNHLVVGQALLILIPKQVHVVRQGETVQNIAGQYGVRVIDIIRNNPFLLNYQSPPPGEAIVISYKGMENRPIIQIGDYAYPFINSYLLRETLPYLSRLIVFSYGFDGQGSLNPINDEYLIRQAKAYGVSPILALTSLNENEEFDTRRIHLVASDQEARKQLIDDLVDITLQKGYAGVDVDFEYISVEDKEGVLEFLEELTTAMNEIGKSVSAAAAPKTSATQRGILYEGVDYRRLGEIANSVLLMTYEWGYAYGPPMAVAPLDKVDQTLQYGLSEIPAHKLCLGIPNYGYDWPLPYERGNTRATTIGNIQAIDIAARNNGEILYDDTAQSPYFGYWKDGIEHVVWFEDVRSIQKKLQLVIENQLLGATYWNLMRYFRPNWLLLHSMAEIARPQLPE